MSIDIGHIKNNNKTASKKRNPNSILNKNISFSKKLGDSKKVNIYKNLAILLKSGIDFKTALSMAKDEQKNTLAKQTMESLLQDVIKGKSLFEAMDKTGQFSPYEVFSVKIGEETRKLNTILEELHKFFLRKVKLKKQVISILTYPAFILVLTIATLYFMLTYVVPLFKSVFNQFDRELPTLTKYVIALSENFKTLFLIFLAVVVIIVIVIQKIKKSTSYRRIISKIILKIPFFGKLNKDIYLTRFCQAMSLLLVSKTSLVESLNLIKKMIGYYPIEHALEQVEKDIVRGHTLSTSLSKFKIFDSNIISMVKVAEQVNQLDTMFLNLANQYNDEVEHKTKTMGTIIEPLMILFIGGIVGIIMISMYAPMFDLSEVIGGK